MKTIVILTNKRKINTIDESFADRIDLSDFGNKNNYFYIYNPVTKLFENQEKFSEGLYLVFDGIDNEMFSYFFTDKNIFILTHKHSDCKPDKASYTNSKGGKHETSCPFYPRVIEIIKNDDINDKIEEIINNVFEFDDKLETILKSFEIKNLCEDKPEITNKVVEINQYIENKQ